MGEHTEDIWSVDEGDDVTITTSEGETFGAECIMRTTEHADPRSGEVREVEMWQFKSDDRQPAVSITNGLKSSPDDPDFPTHNEMWDMWAEENIGYIQSITVR